MEQLLGITMGCPVGIGPEIILLFFAGRTAVPGYTPVVLGDIGVLRHTAATLGLPGTIVPWEPGTPVAPDTVPVYSLSSLPVQELVWGLPDRTTGTAMAAYIEEAVRLTRQGILAGIVTCPISKKALQLAGYPYPGHTEMLAELSGAGECLMMMAGSRLRVALVTIHEPFRRVPELITKESVSWCIRTTARALRTDFGLAHPRIAVAALNPHGGEQGMFGREELEIIGPAIEECAGEGSISGPWPPDTVFHRAASGVFDAVVAMYHDQGLIPFKLLHFKDGVNVTLGLPLVRTSVDHGTAYDIAGQGRADCASLQAAYALAAEIAGNREKAG
ncbi:MAG: 4-hydroxythreonine-4-phosphate dehydrogenase PdxA [Desulfobulbaceae bacterium]